MFPFELLSVTGTTIKIAIIEIQNKIKSDVITMASLLGLLLNLNIHYFNL